jgi:hypothetical protein
MPFGSEITAARSGVVTEIRDQYTDDDRAGGHETGGYVLHEDKTMALSLHMSEDGVLVSVGDEVHTGDVIGLVGTTRGNNRDNDSASPLRGLRRARRRNPVVQDPSRRLRQRPSSARRVGRAPPHQIRIPLPATRQRPETAHVGAYAALLLLAVWSLERRTGQ